jgi:hypothetical protein
MDGRGLGRMVDSWSTGQAAAQFVLTKRLNFHHLRYTFINTHGVNVKVRIQALACINCLLFSGTDECQLITHGETIRALKTTGDDELSFSQLKGKNEEQVEDVV